LKGVFVVVSDQYVRLGISVIPILPGTKKPHYGFLKKVGWCDENGKPIWGPASESVPSQDVCKVWFSRNGTGIALIAGRVSGNLVYLDWDNSEIYREWALAHKSIVNSTAVSKTANGYHVFFRTQEPEAGTHLYYRDKFAGHIRGEGMYVVAPPTLHPAGVRYKWLRHPKDGICEIFDLDEIGLGREVGGPVQLEFDICPVDLSDETIVLRACMREDFQLAWNGEWKFLGLPSQSECDLKICRALSFWCGRDFERVDRIYRQSPSYQVQAYKWDRGCRVGLTYGQATIQLACRSTTATYKKKRKYNGKWRKI
jgi:hypothetical protein